MGKESKGPAIDGNIWTMLIGIRHTQGMTSVKLTLRCRKHNQGGENECELVDIIGRLGGE